MRGSWTTGPGMMAVVGSFGDIEVHHHPAVQLAVGIDGPLALVAGDGSEQRCSIAAVAGGTRHAMRPGGARAGPMPPICPSPTTRSIRC